MMSIASLSSMASPPFEGKPRPPKIQLYCLFYHINPPLHRMHVLLMVLDLQWFAGVSSNVPCITDVPSP
jgi:hypothetical protein